MSLNDLVLVQGMKDSRIALERWQGAPLRVLAPWLGVSALITLGLLLAILVIATLSEPDPTRFAIPGLTAPATGADYLHVLYRNSLVLALHAMACVAGFIAGSSLPLSAANRSGLDRWVHEKAGPLAIGFVVCATTFSLVTQAFVIGAGASTIAAQFDISPAALLMGLLPHAVPELVALFLPLGAWLLASKRGRWDELLAATVLTVAVAVPVLLVSASVELWVSPHLLRALVG
ncbi:MAG: hypothetical protein ACR2FZ_08880 [Thermoleophilaceae bacterium]